MRLTKIEMAAVIIQDRRELKHPASLFDEEVIALAKNHILAQMEQMYYSARDSMLQRRNKEYPPALESGHLSHVIGGDRPPAPPSKPPRGLHLEDIDWPD